MGKASRKKKERRTWLDQPAVVWGKHTMTPLQAQRLQTFREYVVSLDLPPGKPLKFAPTPTWRQIRGHRKQIIDDLILRDK